MLKATGGGGGMGLQVCHNAEEISVAFKKVKSRGETLFKNSGYFLRSITLRVAISRFRSSAMAPMLCILVNENAVSRGGTRK